MELWQPKNRGLLKAQARPGTPDDTDPCLSSPDARYRGENQLYRVEIHNGGRAGGDATFKWSSDNGSVVYPILSLERGSGTNTVTLEHLGRDDRSGLTQGDWVEVADVTTAVPAIDASATPPSADTYSIARRPGNSGAPDTMAAIVSNR